ncbi:MAG TPA: preprotein translocase subunit SecG [Opitutaceae bacterium]|nr:preprotein translocase subunit SecG [Opitutaceae bacterium]
MNILIVVLTFLLVLVSLFLGLLVLVQKPRSDSGLGTAMGGGVAEATFGAETGNVLTRSTIVLAVAFFVLGFGAYLGQIYVVKHKDKSVESLPAAPVSTAPAVPTPAPEAVPAPTPAPAAQP